MHCLLLIQHIHKMLYLQNLTTLQKKHQDLMIRIEMVLLLLVGAELLFWKSMNTQKQEGQKYMLN